MHEVTKRGNIGNLKYLSWEVNMQRCVRTNWTCSVLTQSYYLFNQPLEYETNKKSKHGGEHYVWTCLVSLCCCQFQNFELHQASLWTEIGGEAANSTEGDLRQRSEWPARTNQESKRLIIAVIHPRNEEHQALPWLRISGNRKGAMRGINNLTNPKRGLGSE